jgi:hypothetical protein
VPLPSPTITHLGLVQGRQLMPREWDVVKRPADSHPAMSDHRRPGHPKSFSFPTANMYGYNVYVAHLVKLGFHPSIPYAVHLELEAQSSTVDNHLEREIQIIKLDSSRRGQASKETSRNGVEIGRERAHVDQVAGVRRRWLIRIAGNEVVRHYEGLPGSEIPCVVKRDGCEW